MRQDTIAQAEQLLTILYMKPAKRQKQTYWQVIVNLFTCERHLVYNMPGCHHIYIFLFHLRIGKALEVVNFFIETREH